MKRKIRILLVEDNEEDCIILYNCLQRGGYKLSYHIVSDPIQMEKYLHEDEWDLVISSDSIPGFSGLAPLDLFKKQELDIPFIIFSGKISDGDVVTAIQAGAHGYIYKKNINRLISVIDREMEYAKARREKRCMQKALLQGEKEKSAILNSISELVVYHDLDMNIIWANQAASKNCQSSMQALVGKKCCQIWHAYQFSCANCLVHSTLAQVEMQNAEVVFPDGRVWLVNSYPMRDDKGNLCGAVKTLLDITERIQSHEIIKAQANIKSVVAELGLFALERIDMYTLFEKAVQHISDVLCLEYAEIWKCLPEKKHLVLFSAHGWNKDIEGREFLDAGSLNQITYSLQTNESVVMDGLQNDTRFDIIPLFVNEQIVSGISVVLQGNDGPFGVVGGHSKSLRKFSAYEIDFLQEIVHLLSIAIKRYQTQEENARLQEQLMQSQKMEAVGRLAGGIAHDFNNLLTVINGYSEILRTRLGQEPGLKKFVDEIAVAGDRAASLTRQLLTFSRKQVLESNVLCLNTIVAEMKSFLYRLIGEDIHLVTNLSPDLNKIKAERGQIEQIIMNLAINARDAMPDGGTLIFETASVQAHDYFYVKNHPLKNSSCVMLTVRDTGQGIDKAVLPNIFEPFFTTKEVGKGTGLGLSIVYGIIKQNGGEILVDSKIGKGTEFRLFFPVYAEESRVFRTVPTPIYSYDGNETLLLVEDNAAVRDISKDILVSFGYTVIEAADGEEALKIIENGDVNFDLILTDVVLPGMNGYELVQHVREIVPAVKVLYMSGYTNDLLFPRHSFNKNEEFIAKPFVPVELVRKIRSVLPASSKAKLLAACV